MPSIRHSLTINLRHLVDPRATHEMWETSPAVAFEAYRWMVATAANYRDSGAWGSRGVWEYLFLKPCCTGVSPSQYYSIYGSDWASQLRVRFQHALLCDCLWCPVLGRWRADLGLDTLGTISVPIRHYRPAQSFGTVCRTMAFTRLMGLTGRFVNSPSECHRKARTVYRVGICTYENCHVISAQYGHAGDRDSSWHYKLAVQGKRECFDDFANRAIAEAGRLIVSPKETK